MRSIQLPDGRIVRGRGLRNGPVDSAPDYGLYLGSSRLRSRHDPDLLWPHEWIEWPDFLLPRDRAGAVEAIIRLHERAGTGLVEVACGGGVGRTGTVISCLAILAGVPAEDAVDWARAHYHHRAVETPWQRSWVRRFPSR
jgi:hypothetical protein